MGPTIRGGVLAGALAALAAVLFGGRLAWWIQLAMAVALVALSVDGMGPAGWFDGYGAGYRDGARLHDGPHPAPRRDV